MLISKISMLLLSLIIYLSGWMMPAIEKDWEQDDPVAKSVHVIQKHIAHKRWDLAKREVKRLPHIFYQQKWKYQLMGDEGEYEEIDLEISKLLITVELKEEVETRSILASILNILKEIYSL